MLNSEAYYVNDGAFYIGQTPPQDKPIQTIVRNVDGWGSPIGFSATNMRYVTITKSRFYNNARRHRPERAGLGEVPAAGGQRRSSTTTSSGTTSTSTRATRRSRSATTGRPRRWRRSAPASCCSAAAGTWSRTTGSTATTSAASRRSTASCCTKNPQAISLDRNTVRNNAFGLNGTDLNGHDIVYDGSGSDNCFSLGGVGDTVPGRQVDVRARAPAERVQPGRRASRCSSGPARARSTGWDQARRTRPSRASSRWRSSTREDAPRPHRRPGRRRALERGAGAGRQAEAQDGPDLRQLLPQGRAEGEGRARP